jgi:DNA-binding CsgD family transcriptional regulator
MNHPISNENLSTLISEAAFDPAKWVDVCDGLAQLSGATGAVILPFACERRHFGLPHSPCLEASFERYMHGGWYLRDVRDRGYHAMVSRGYGTDADCIAYDEMSRSDYYEDFLRPVGLRWFVGIGFTVSQQFWVLSVQNALRKEPFTQEQIDLLLPFRGKLENAATLAMHLGNERLRGAADALEMHDRAMIALGEGGRVIYISPSALKYVGSIFKISQNRVQAMVAKESDVLQRLITTLCCNRPVANASHSPVALSRGDGESPVIVYGSAPPARERDIFVPALALLMIVDPARGRRAPVPLIMSYFAVTAAEAKLAAALHTGETLERYVINNAISIVTARNQLQSLLRKTGAHSKAELVATIGKIIP